MGDPMRAKIDTNLGWLRVVKTRPVSYGWSNQYETALALVVNPLKTSLALLVSRMTSWMTMFSRLTVSGGGLPPTPLALIVKSRGTYLLGAYVLAVENPYLLEVGASENL
jgi:hypothetical protein